MLALAIDIGLVAVARTQAQNAADSAAMTGSRTLNGDSTANYNYSNAIANATNAATANKLLGKNVQSSDVQVEVGTYAYVYNDSNPNSEGFQLQIPRVDPTEPYTALRATVDGKGQYAFAPLLGMSTLNTRAVSVGAHRPRDIMIIMDLSGSMRFQSLPGVPMSGGQANAASSNSPRTQSMNPDPIFPQFGHYSDVSGAALQGTSSIPTTTGEYVDPSNISSTQNSGPPICADFYSNAVGSPASPSNAAFAAASSAYATTPGGDDHLKTSRDTGGTYAQTLAQFNGASSNTYPAFEINGYKAVRSQFNGYTQGPGYWGKTFWVWPPNPCGPNVLSPPSSVSNTSFSWHNNQSNDWRQRFFVAVNTSTNAPSWINHNTILYNSVGSTPVMKKPGDTTTVTENGSSVTYTFRINYSAILNWLQTSPSQFPSTLAAGRIRYYTSIPSGTDTTLNNRWWTTNPTSLSNNERFWKEYIDFVLGYVGTGANTYSNVNGSSVPYSAFIGNGDYYTWTGSTAQISARPQPQPPASTPNAPYQTGTLNANASSGSTSVKVNLTTKPTANSHYLVFPTLSSTVGYLITAVSGSSSPYTLTITSSPPSSTGLSGSLSNGAAVSVYSPYMSYTDNPPRPRHQYWFGPMSMVDWLGNYNLTTLANNSPHHWWPGNCHEAHAWACKVGIQTSIDYIKNNHPNDFVGMTFFSSPKTSAAGAGHHNRAVVPLGRKYQQLVDSLWFPATTVTGTATEIGPYDPSMDQTPRADGGTAPGMGFMISYNQFSSSVTNLRTYATPTSQYRGDAGGQGRKGATRLIIFETDGCPNTRANAALAGSGPNSYYPIRIKDPTNLSSSSNVEWPSGGTYSNSEVYAIVQQITALDTASPPGYSSSGKLAKVYCIGYGGDFDPANTSTNSTNALTFLQTVQYYGNTSTDTNPGNFPMFQRIYGPNATRIANMQSAISKILQSGVQVSLVQ